MQSLYIKHIILSLSFCYFNFAHGQISPGKLAQAHAHLEGISNCTQCHNIGDKISEEKCLNCHTQLKSRIQNNKGFHVSSEVIGKSCISCHSEHHGVKFQMIRFDKKTFNHNLTGYELKGSHKREDCISCHKPANIQNEQIKKNPNTYLGLEKTCTSCHEDKHQKTLGTDCASCHDFEHFKPAPLFNHAKTDFALTGAHAKVDCASCHKIEQKNGKMFQRFALQDFKSCVSCHADEHKGRFGNNCKACHVDESFHKIRPTNAFNHSIVGFVLEGKHKSLQCKTCHSKSEVSGSMFKEFSKSNEHTCNTCHLDVHDGKFGLNCKDCHNQNSFKLSGSALQFNHSLTAFPLVGLHSNVDCKKCHKTGAMTDPVVHNYCYQCHTDYHKGEFNATQYTDCNACHTEFGFKETKFSLEQHDVSSFPLKGAHLAVECSACHHKNTNWTFRNIGTTCNDCHHDVHKDAIDKKYYQVNNCQSCHNEESWSDVSFDHTITAFPLEGKHKAIACRSCHVVFDSAKNELKYFFKVLPKECQYCHSDPHDGQFLLDGITDCRRCHGFTGWNGKFFDHNGTRFPLTGEHKSVSCDRCHEAIIQNQKKIIVYRNNKLECKDCHH